MVQGFLREGEVFMTKVTKEEAFEIIELAIEDIDVLTRAFTLIQDVCDELQDRKPAVEIDSLEEIVIN